ncbi:MAG: methyltransferase domain-containing protein [Campylobacterales bacterium]|nr:methyltransferase domain-containing protein [Campylobacterales bacterium]
MNIAQEFSRFASNYERVNVIQKQVASQLIAKLEQKKYNTILDLGCGSGEIYKNIVKQGIAFEHFTGVDISAKMLELHPQESRVDLQCASFETIKPVSCDVVLSSSALQWSSDIDRALSHIAKLSNRFYFAIFTANTFKTLHQCAQISSPIYPVAILQESIERYFDAKYELKSYRLPFDTTYEMLRYIKGSGVSGGQKQLTYTQIKKLMQVYPLEYLEFEVLFVEAKALREAKSQ